MLNNNLKNIVVLKNLPSNLIDEAIIVLKSKKTAKKFELIEKKSTINYRKELENNNEYLIKEAEMVVNNYIAKMEKDVSKKNKIEKKYKRIKIYSIFMSMIVLFILIRFFL